MLRHAFTTEKFLSESFKGRIDEMFNVDNYNKAKAQELKDSVQALRPKYTAQLIAASEAIDAENYKIQKSLEEGETIGEYKDKFFSERLFSVMQNEASEDKFVNERGMLIQVMDPGFQVPLKPSNPLNYRAHFYAPVKHFMGFTMDTLYFNLGVIWFMTILLYVSLYYEWMGKSLRFLGSLGKKDK